MVTVFLYITFSSIPEDVRFAAPLLPKSTVSSITGLWQTACTENSFVFFTIKRGVGIKTEKLAGGLSVLRQGKVSDYL